MHLKPYVHVEKEVLDTSPVPVVACCRQDTSSAQVSTMSTQYRLKQQDDFLGQAADL